MNNVDKQYTDLLRDILAHGVEKDTRSGMVKSVFGRQMRFDLKEGFPLLTTKKVFYKGIIHELLWFVSGNTNIKYLVDNKVNIWTDDAYRYYTDFVKRHNAIVAEGGDTQAAHLPAAVMASKEEFVEKVVRGEKCQFAIDRNTLTHYTYGDLGEMYGKNWRNFDGTFDQIQYVIDTIKHDPDSRRILLTCYNPATAGSAALYPCHILYQFYVSHGALSCMMTQRSVDTSCGLPFNIASAALLTHMIAEVCSLAVGELIWVGGDTHIYSNHFEPVGEQLARKGFDQLPTLRFARKITSVDDFKYDDFLIENYQSDPTIKFVLNT